MEWKINPHNPGEVFACAGLAHLAWREDRAAETGFDLAGDEYRFVVPDLAASFERLAKAPSELLAKAPPSEETKKKKEESGLIFAGIELDWWMKWGLNSGLKIWTGNQTGTTLHESLYSAIQGEDPIRWLKYRAFPQQDRRALFYVDTDCTWDTLGMGFSANTQKMKVSCRPWLGLLASIGLQAFPVQGSKSDGFRYHLWRPSGMASAIPVFGGHGPEVYSVGGFVSKTSKAGENTVLRRAVEVAG